jgi:hypothetical protein
MPTSDARLSNRATTAASASSPLACRESSVSVPSVDALAGPQWTVARAGSPASTNSPDRSS